jgi:hypothetical protein
MKYISKVENIVTSLLKASSIYLYATAGWLAVLSVAQVAVAWRRGVVQVKLGFRYVSAGLAVGCVEAGQSGWGEGCMQEAWDMQV